MKPPSSIPIPTSLVVGGLLLFAWVARTQAQSYSLAGFKIAGGGGTSTGGVYTVTGTIGQPEASPTPMSGGQFSLTGGFWTLPVAIQTPDAPTLVVVLAAPGSATISWIPNTPGFVLQETLSLPPTNWINSASGTTNPVTVPALAPTRFYRLLKP